jgi:glycosyltransferase involved in cell wall biosynthesis
VPAAFPPARPRPAIDATERPAVRVAFDATALLAGNTGVARYVRELTAVMPFAGAQLSCFAIGRGDRGNLPPGTRHLRLPLRMAHRAWSVAGIPPAEVLAPGCEIVHTPDLVPPPARAPLVLTVHDLVALEHPDLHPPRSTAVQRAQLAAARDRASVVLAVSEATAATLRGHGVDPARIVVAPNGVTPLGAPDPSAVPVAPFFLAVGSLTPRKGFGTLVAAFARAALPRDVRLVLAGPDGWDAGSVHDAIARHDPDGRVVRAGRVTDAQLAALYQRCIAVCVPSIAEGFGLPVLEGAAAGATVVASDLPVFRELEPAVSAFAPASDVHAWSRALEHVHDDALQIAPAAAARAFARDFTWERTATITVGAYERAREAARP